MMEIPVRDPSFLEIISYMDDIDAINYLQTIRGISSWLAKMCLLFVLQQDDVFPYEDGVFLQYFKWL